MLKGFKKFVFFTQGRKKEEVISEFEGKMLYKTAEQKLKLLYPDASILSIEEISIKNISDFRNNALVF